jgi:hypothetical protein
MIGAGRRARKGRGVTASLGSRQNDAVPLSGPDRAEAFLSWADERADGKSAQFKLFDEGGRPSITAIWYRDCPSPGWGTGLTYGASVSGNPGVELMIVIRSRDPVWGWALAYFVDHHRDEIQHIQVGDTINWHEPIARHTTMDAFVIGPAVGAPDGEEIVHLDHDDHVNLLQAFPVYSSELALIRDLGIKAFAQSLGDDLVNPRRSAVA